MIEEIKKHSSFAITLVIMTFAISVMLSWWVIKVPWFFIFCWTGFIIGVPIIWKRYGTGVVLEFWKGWVIRLAKCALVLFLFLLIRSFFVYIVQFSIFETYIGFTESTGATMFLGYTPGKILYEAVFMLLFGLLTLEAVFNGPWKKLCWTIIGCFLVGCFLFQTAAYSLGYKDNKIVQTAAKPIGPEAMNAAVEDNGVLGGLVKQLWVTMFGKKKPILNSANFGGNILPGTISNSTYEPIPFGNSQIIIEPGQEKRVRLPDCAIWDITRDEKSEIDITPFGGKTFQWRPDRNEYTHFSNKDKMFALVNKGQTAQTLKFIIKPLGTKI